MADGPGVKLPIHLSFVTTEEQAEEIKAIAAAEGLWKGQVLRALIARGLKDYYSLRGDWKKLTK